MNRFLVALLTVCASFFNNAILSQTTVQTVSRQLTHEQTDTIRKTINDLAQSLHADMQPIAQDFTHAFLALAKATLSPEKMNSFNQALKTEAQALQALLAPGTPITHQSIKDHIISLESTLFPYIQETQAVIAFVIQDELLIHDFSKAVLNAILQGILKAITAQEQTTNGIFALQQPTLRGIYILIGLVIALLLMYVIFRLLQKQKKG